MRDWLRRMVGHLAAPLRDLLEGLDLVLGGRLTGLAWVFAGLAAGWWVYVPVHELLHVAGCLLAGGSVERLDLDPIYGAGWLSRVLPFVHSGSEYAGRLSGFDTRGSDWIYLATDLGPFVLAFLPGLWAVRSAARAARPFWFGAALPFAYSPWLSATGDAYEIGSLTVSQIPAWSAQRQILLGDDLFLRARELGALEHAPWVGFGLAALLGLFWALATTAAGSALAAGLGQKPLESPRAAAPR